jgi:hypothetical protein
MGLDNSRTLQYKVTMGYKLLIRIIAVALGAGAIAGMYFWVVSAQPAHVVAFGEPIRQDDFLYTVVGVTKSRTIGDGTVRAAAHGLFYVASIDVKNEAMRVSYRWDPAIVYVVDASGRTFQFSVDGQRALDAARPQSQMVDAGDSARFQVAFDLPAGVDRPALAFSNGILMGDVFDGAAYSRARVPLE